MSIYLTPQDPNTVLRFMHAQACIDASKAANYMYEVLIDMYQFVFSTEVIRRKKMYKLAAIAANLATDYRFYRCSLAYASENASDEEYLSLYGFLRFVGAC